VIGDIELAHVTTLPSQLLAARFVSNDHAFVVTRNGVLDATPHANNPIHVGSRGFELTAADISADARWAVVTGRHDVTLWDVRKFNPSRLSSTQPGEIIGTAVAPDGRSVVTFATDRSLRVWQLERGGPDRLPISGEPDAFAVIDERAIITTQTATGHLLLAWSPGDLPVKVDVPHAASDDITWTTTNGASPPVAASGNLVAVMMAARLELVDLAKGTHAELDVEGYPARLAFSPNGKQLLAAGAKLQVWDVATHALTVPHGAMAAWLGDGRLVTADRSNVSVGTTKLDLDTCVPSALDARDDIIAVGCRNGTVRVFDSGRLRKRADVVSRSMLSPIAQIAIGPRGRVAAAGTRPEVFVYDPDQRFATVLYGETRAVSRLHWVGEVLETATPSDGWIWDPEAPNGGAKLPPGAKILLGAHHAFAANQEEHVVRATLLPPRLLVGFRAWVAARSR
jgi:WD40 repeat protein